MSGSSFSVWDHKQKNELNKQYADQPHEWLPHGQQIYAGEEQPAKEQWDCYQEADVQQGLNRVFFERFLHFTRGFVPVLLRAPHGKKRGDKAEENQAKKNKVKGLFGVGHRLHSLVAIHSSIETIPVSRLFREWLDVRQGALS
ncbi:MAG: hypothetical protein AAF801_14555 [Pseudomonadota bacterium]